MLKKCADVIVWGFIAGFLSLLVSFGFFTLHEYIKLNHIP